MTVRMAVVIDYQNVHLTAAQLFLPGRPSKRASSSHSVSQNNSRRRATATACTRSKLLALKFSVESQSQMMTPTATVATLNKSHSGNTDIRVWFQ